MQDEQEAGASARSQKARCQRLPGTRGWSYSFLSVQKATLGTGSRGRGHDPSFSSICSMVFRCGEAKVLEAWRLQFGASFLSVQTASESHVRHRQLRAEGLVRPSVALFCCGQAKVLEVWRLQFEATFGTGRRGPKAGPSFSSILFRCGEAKVLDACRLQFGGSFLSVQKATLGTGSRGLEAWSVLQ